MDKETLEKMLDILKKERTHLAIAISGCFDAIKAEADKEDVDALMDAVMDLRDYEIEQATIRRVCNRFENLLFMEHADE